MFFRSLYLLGIVSLLSLVTFGSQDGGVQKLDPFLQRELKQNDQIGLMRQADPGIPSPALSKLRESDEMLYNVIFHGDERAFDDLGFHFNSRIDGIATARISSYDLLRAGLHPGIHHIETGGMMTIDLNSSRFFTRVELVHDADVLNTPFKGNGSIIGIIDTGIDFLHPDFRDPDDQNRSRILSIWDVRLSPRSNESHPVGFDYGVEYFRDDIERDLRGETQNAIRSIDRNGHGTHVAGIAGGNGIRSSGTFSGMAPEAEFIIVAFPDARFFASEVIDALNYIFSRAQQLGRPAVVNLSIGGHGGSHDGTAGHEQVITNHANRIGRAITVASGNSGEDDIHFGDSVSPGEQSEFSLRIPTYNPDLINHDDYVLKMLWYESTDVFEVTVISPNGYQVTAQSGDSVLVATLDGAVEIDTFDDYRNPVGARVFVIDIHTSATLISPVSGEWRIKVRNVSAGSGVKFNSWIASSSIIGPTQVRPTLSPNSGRDYTVSMPGTAQGALTVGAFTSRRQWTSRDGRTWHFPAAVVGDLASFSGGGPTRDGRQKPDIVAPGQIIGSAQARNASFQAASLLPDSGYVLLQGTSMATPHLAGIVALIFEANPNLTGNQIIDIIQNSGRSDNYTGFTPNNSWGYGKADAREMFNHFVITSGIPEEFYLSQNYPNPFNAETLITFAIPEPTSGNLTVYDVLGRKVKIIMEGEFEPRLYTVEFNGTGLSSGVYFYRLTTDTFTGVQKMILLR
jgi:subtilisin family serine protease